MKQINDDCIGCSFAHCPKEYKKCPCRLCIVKCVCTKSCLDRIRSFGGGEPIHFKLVRTLDKNATM